MGRRLGEAPMSGRRRGQGASRAVSLDQCEPWEGRESLRDAHGCISPLHRENSEEMVWRRRLPEVNGSVPSLSPATQQSRVGWSRVHQRKHLTHSKIPSFFTRTVKDTHCDIGPTKSI